MFCDSGMLVLPESPAWLMEKGNTEAANRALERINGTSHCSIVNENKRREDSSSWDPGFPGPPLSSPFRRRSRNRSRESGSGLGRINSRSPLRENELGLGDHDLSEEKPAGLVRHSNDNTYAFVRSRWNALRIKLHTTKLTLSRYRNQVYILLFLAVAQQFCGQTNILSYAPLIFAEVMKQDGDDENNDNGNDGEKDMSMIIIGSVKFFVTILVIWRIEYMGRRFLLISGNILIAIGLLALVIAFGGSSNNIVGVEDEAESSAFWSPLTNIKTFHLALPGVLLVVSGYSMSFGPLTWLLTSEIFPTEIRGRALGYSTIITYMCGALATETFLYTQSLLGPSFVFGIYCIIAVTSALFGYLAIPDTGGKTVEEIEESLSQMYWWKYSAIALSQNDEDGGADCVSTSDSISEMVRNPSQLSVHSLT